MEKGQQKPRPQNESKSVEQSTRLEGNESQKPPLQCWGCGGPHYTKNCPYHGRFEQVTNIQEASAVGEVAKSIPKLNAALEVLRNLGQLD